MTELTLDLQTPYPAPDIPDRADFQRWAQQAWLGRESTEVTLRIVDEAESAALNGQFRHKAYPTNVLSFPFEAPPGVPVSLLGDIVLCAPVVHREALAQGKKPADHWAHLTIHGMLHLQGYDHIEPAEADIMEALERRMLASLGIADPYQGEPDQEDTDPQS